MRPHNTSNHQRIARLSVIAKLMFFIMLGVLMLVMVRGILPEAEPPPEPLRVNVARLPVGGMQGVEWNRQRLLIIHSAEGPHYLVISDYDPIYGCPMQWVAPGSDGAPLQPWPGGLRAICIDHWFDSAGISLTRGVGNLKRLPYTLEGAETLVVTPE